MLSSVVENCRKEMARYKKMTVYAVIKKNFPTNEEMPYFSLNCEVEINPETEEDVEKNIVTQLFKSYELDKVKEQFDKLQTMI